MVHNMVLYEGGKKKVFFNINYELVKPRFMNFVPEGQS
jgi:hypothetical protein